MRAITVEEYDRLIDDLFAVDKFVGMRTAMRRRAVTPREYDALIDDLFDVDRFVEPRAAGGPGSGNFGHAGRPGEVGGSSRDPKNIAGRLKTSATEDVPGRAVNITQVPKQTKFLLPDGTRISGRNEWGEEHADILFSATRESLDDAFQAGIIRYSGGEYGGIQFAGTLTEEQAQTLADDWNITYSQSNPARLYIDAVPFKDGKLDYYNSVNGYLQVPFTADKLRNFSKNQKPELLTPLYKRAARKWAKETIVHKAADAHVAKMSVALRFAFAMGKNAINKTRLATVTDPREAMFLVRPGFDALETALEKVLPSVLEATLVAGGQAGLTLLQRQFRTAGGPGSGNFGHGGGAGGAGNPGGSDGQRAVIGHLSERVLKNTAEWQEKTGNTSAIMKSRVLNLYKQATAEQIRDGNEWYPQALAHAERMAQEHGLTTKQAAGVIAALSPMREWTENLTNAEDVIRSVVRGDAVPEVQKLLSANVDKATDILNGASPEAVLWRSAEGFKVRSFYTNIINPASREATIDTHMLRVLLADNSISTKEHGKYAANAGRYSAFRQAILDAADAVGATPASVQAVVWVVQKAQNPSRSKIGKNYLKAAAEMPKDRVLAILLDAVRALFPEEGIKTLGGPGSGNFGHAGRPGQVGGSAKGSGFSGLLRDIGVPDGGFSYSPLTRTSPTKGYMVSIHKGRELVIDAKDLNGVKLAEYVKKNADLLLTEGSSDYLGAWHNPKDGKVYLDVSRHTFSRAKASLLGKQHDQEAYFDLGNGKSVDLKPEKEHVKAAEAHVDAGQGDTGRSDRTDDEVDWETANAGRSDGDEENLRARSLARRRRSIRARLRLKIAPRLPVAEVLGIDPEKKLGPANLFKIKFDVTHEDVFEWIAAHTAELVEGITDTTRDRVQQAVYKAFDAGRLPDAISQIVEALDTDTLVKNVLGAMGNQERAEMIARTETMTAANEGQRQVWAQAMDQGLLPNDIQREWIATSDANVCPICEELNGARTSIEGEYPDPGGDGPPQHPNCRCTEGIVG